MLPGRVGIAVSPELVESMLQKLFPPAREVTLPLVPRYAPPQRTRILATVTPDVLERFQDFGMVILSVHPTSRRCSRYG